MKPKKSLNNNFAYMLKKYKYNLHPGDIVAGTIIYKEYNGFLVNIGDNITGYLPQEEIGLTNIIINNYTKLNSLINITREFFLVTHNPHLKQSILSIKRLEYIRGWKRIKQYQNENIIFNLKIKHFNKGGIITYLDNIHGFIPKSHIYLKNNKIKFEKQNIKCKLITANEQNNRLILSNKSALLYLSKHKFRLGELIYGKVKQIKPYGLFIEIYGIIALLHISEITDKYINNIYNFFHIEKIIKVKIIHIDMKQGRLSVSRRYNIK
uniref:Ribosomal protein S1 n=1 Tax=Acrosorium ciliolatum TaxID=1550622 RepID=A0A1Z1M1Y8_9FLOR|nr:ribosomal protein S1 [Acrosorium ciliolatum]ARW60089.1 ribosomal protein S1 [Acrosorium ciliolatum]